MCRFCPYWLVRIGEVARRTGVSISALRAWERRFGMLAPGRTAGGQRQYAEADVERVLTVRRLVAEGLTLPTAVGRVGGADGASVGGEGETLVLRQILQAVNQGVWVAREGRTRFANRRMTELLGRSLDEVLAASAFDFVEPDSIPLVKERIAELRQGLRQHYEVPFRRGDGSTFLAEVSASPILDGAGRYQGSVAIVSDITARKEEETKARFRAALLDAVGEAVIAATPEGILSYVNPAGARMFGWPASEVVGTSAYSFPTAIESAEALADMHVRMTAGQTFSGELPMVRRDGSRFVGDLTTAPLQDEQGRMVGVISVIRDISDRLRKDQELRTRELEASTVALLGARALTKDRDGAGDEDAVLEESVGATRRVLGVERAAVLEEAPDGRWAVRAASPLLELPSVVPAGSSSLAGYTALARTVVVVEDASLERRFDLGAAGPDTRSAIGAPVFGPLGVRAVLTAESSATHSFDNAEPFVQGIANVVGAALK
jgi:PAS domain S-box-containing protein